MSKPLVYALSFTFAFALIPSVVDAQQCGWVLWQKDTNLKVTPNKPLSNTVNWFPEDGFDTIANCREAGQQNLAELLARYKTLQNVRAQVKPGRSEVMFAFPVAADGTVETNEVSYLCFPGGFDPRR
jgi:hypothetical protein